jgi:predicted AlkP superfamily pyrophosphatase or phosphodiesterase
MLNDHTLARFAPFAPGLVKPIYADYSFANIASTVEFLFSGERRGPLLPPDVFGGAYPRPKRIVTILVDAFGYEFWQRYADRSRVMSHILSDGILTPISALFPSTTAASITTLNLALPPSAHALYEWNVYIPAYGEVIQSLAFTTLGPNPTRLEQKGCDPRALVTRHETLHTRLKKSGVRSVQLAHADYAHSAYNSVISVDAELVPHETLGQALGHLRAHVEAPPTRPELIGFYWAGLDYVAHMYGPASREFEAATLGFWEALDATLAGVRPRDTLFLITADHGHVGARAEDTIQLNEEIPALRGWLSKSPNGEPIWPNGSPRDMFLHIAPDHRAEALSTIRRCLDGIATVTTVDDALAAGLFGDGPIDPELRRRLGDILVLPRLGEFVWWHEPGLIANSFNGHHGGLSREEMTTVLAVAPGF